MGGVSTSIVRVAKIARFEEVATYADIREGRATVNPKPNFAVTSSTIESILPTSEVSAMTFAAELQVLVQLDQPTISEGTTTVMILIPSDGGEEEEEPLDYAGSDSTDSYRSRDVDSLAEVPWLLWLHESGVTCWELLVRER
ncbi:uncharacterized protein A4U43_C03F23820 [Asparagus officinalis]|uniref:Uncharacterized protein n=1 Tax=Asparagus officinalis TaxID=4686 RepID=A0A5P1FCH4_ASPOF|nr:uncharacterized protein A4U43_C03F23820 [Asparagus officinalis]